METIIDEQPKVADETLTESGFYWREHDGVKVLVCRPLEDAGFINGFSTRLGGVSPFPENDLNLAGFNEDTPENIHENRRRFLAALGGDHKLATAWQVHGDNVRVVSTTKDVDESDERADAVISELPAALVGVKTADCVPILVADPKTGAFAAVHAGWRGTVQSIAVKTIAAMSKRYGSNAADLVCGIGPAAGHLRYEVGQDVIDAFAGAFPEADDYFTSTRDGHALIDLRRANKRQLTDSGIAESNIRIAPFCTMEHTNLFFSYRIEKTLYGKTGRLLSVIGRA